MDPISFHSLNHQITCNKIVNHEPFFELCKQKDNCHYYRQTIDLIKMGHSFHHMIGP